MLPVSDRFNPFRVARGTGVLSDQIVDNAEENEPEGDTQTDRDLAFRETPARGSLSFKGVLGPLRQFDGRRSEAFAVSVGGHLVLHG